MAKINIIPMSGSGSRFANEGYILPKPLIPVSGLAMILQVIKRMPPADKWIFIIRKEHVSEWAIDKFLMEAVPNAIIVIDTNPHGQASTTMLAMTHVNDYDELFIAACDNSFLYDQEKFQALRSRSDVDAITWTFTSDSLLVAAPNAWGWVKLEEDGETIADMSVKVPVSEDPLHDHAVVATFWFRSARDFKDAYVLMEKADHRINGELYVDAMPIFLRQLNKKTVIFDVDLYVSWGKPVDLYLYQNYEYLHHRGLLDNKKWKQYFE